MGLIAIFGVDIHPQYQAGINIEQIRAEGFDFMAVKLSEATDTYNGLDWIRRGRACGLLSLGYHYLRPGDEDAQAAVFAGQLQAAGGIPGMLDAEALAGDGKTPTLNVAGIRKFLDACAARGVRVPLLYLPKWYWQRMGSPDLSGLPMLWASSYVPGTGFVSALYENVTPSYWAAYGNLPTAVLQFTDKAAVAGYTVDASAFLGPRTQFAALIGSRGDQDMTPEEHQLLQDCRDELYRRIPTRAGDGPNPGYTDTMLGYACNADGFGYRIEQRLIATQAALATLAQAVAAQHGLNLDDIKALLDQELAKVVNVKVTVDGPAK